ncbi:MAG: hypothetical protein ACOYMG_26135 [Candidatus Methylumidiphilus sp.]
MNTNKSNPPLPKGGNNQNPPLPKGGRGDLQTDTPPSLRAKAAALTKEGRIIFNNAQFCEGQVYHQEMAIAKHYHSEAARLLFQADALEKDHATESTQT